MAHCFLGASPMQQMGIAAYLRNLAVRCNHVARGCNDLQVQESLGAISAELAEKAEVLEAAFRVSPTTR